MDEMMDILKRIQNDLTNQKQEMQSMQENITKSINNNIDEKFSLIEDRTKKLEIKLNEQQKRLDNFEKQIRRKNLILYGVEETERGYMELQEQVLSLINNKMNVNIQRTEIEMVRRLGKIGGKIRPILITLTTMGRKIEILKKIHTLESSTINIKEDFPKEVMLKRKELQQIVNKERQLGKNAVLRYDKIVILKNKSENTLAKDTRNQKRNLSESPEHHQNTTSTVQAGKEKNKTNNITSYMNTASPKNTREPITVEETSVQKND
uniref:Endonuclease-reverse transcriptase n=1 Tax=Heliothis virescens TaxID=7102 RepID=A0A2A4JB54_HELVI